MIVISLENYVDNIGKPSLCIFCDVKTEGEFACDPCWNSYNLGPYLVKQDKITIDRGGSAVEMDKAVCHMLYAMAYEIRVNEPFEKELLREGK